MKKGLLWAAALVALAIAGEQWMCGPSMPELQGPGSVFRKSGSPLIGQPAPAFELTDLSGATVRLSQFHGKVVLLDFWATWCGPCRRSMPMLDRLQAEIGGEVVLLAINLQESEDIVRSYIQRQGFRARVLLDHAGRTGSDYGIQSIPMQVLVDPEGVVRDVVVGFSPALEGRMREQIEKLRRPADPS